MSDPDNLDTFDLDTAFDRLAVDVDAHTRAPSAERAIRAAGHRRIAVAGGALAAAAVLAAVVVGGLGLPVNQSVQPVAIPAPSALPEPNTFNAAAFNAAADGWTRDWTEAAPQVSTDVPCIPDPDIEVPKPLDSTSTGFRAGARTGATLTVESFDTDEHAYEKFTSQAVGACPGQEIDELPDELWTGGESLNYGIKNSRERFYELNVLHDREVATLVVAGADELPEDVRKRIVYALLADLRS
jgi:hypothetical protein